MMNQCVRCGIIIPKESPMAKLLPRTPREVTLCYSCWIQYEIDRKHYHEVHNSFPDYHIRDAS